MSRWTSWLTLAVLTGALVGCEADAAPPESVQSSKASAGVKERGVARADIAPPRDSVPAGTIASADELPLAQAQGGLTVVHADGEPARESAPLEEDDRLAQAEVGADEDVDGEAIDRDDASDDGDRVGDTDAFGDTGALDDADTFDDTFGDTDALDDDETFGDTDAFDDDETFGDTDALDDADTFGDTDAFDDTAA